MAKHFLTKCTNGNKAEHIEVQLIEQVQEGNYDLEGRLWCREKYWQAQLFTLSHGMNSTWDWYSTNRKSYRKKKKVIAFLIYYIAHVSSLYFEFLSSYSVIQAAYILY